MIGSFNFYYAKPGLEEAVLRQRLAASDVRVAMGVPRGRVLQRTSGPPTLPDVMWEYHFAEMAGHHADMAARAASPEFEAIRAGMRKLYRRFERPLFEICADIPAKDPQPARVVTLDWIFCAPERSESIETDVRRLITVDKPGRLFRLITPGDDLPQFLCQRKNTDELPFTAEDVGAERVEASSWTVEDPT